MIFLKQLQKLKLYLQEEKNIYIINDNNFSRNISEKVNTIIFVRWYLAGKFFFSRKKKKQNEIGKLEDSGNKI